MPLNVLCPFCSRRIIIGIAVVMACHWLTALCWASTFLALVAVDPCVCQDLVVKGKIFQFENSDAPALRFSSRPAHASRESS